MNRDRTTRRRRERKGRPTRVVRSTAQQRIGARPASGLWVAHRDWLWFSLLVVAATLLDLPAGVNSKRTALFIIVGFTLLFGIEQFFDRVLRRRRAQTTY